MATVADLMPNARAEAYSMPVPVFRTDSDVATYDRFKNARRAAGTTRKACRARTELFRSATGFSGFQLFGGSLIRWFDSIQKYQAACKLQRADIDLGTEETRKDW